jgi:hypothetical protein
VIEKLIKGRYLNFSYPVPKLTYALGDFLTQPKVALTIEQSVQEKLNVPKWDSKTQRWRWNGQDLGSGHEIPICVDLSLSHAPGLEPLSYCGLESSGS